MAFLRWRQGQPAGTKKEDCPPEILNRKAELADLSACGRFQSRTDIAYSVLFSPTQKVASSVIMLDEIKIQTATEQKSPDLHGRLIIESSPANFQLWLRFNRSLTDEQRVGLMKKFSPDAASATAVRNGRMPSFTNRKPKHAPTYPFAKIFWCRFGTTTPEALDGLLPEIKGREIRSYSHAPTPFVPDKTTRRMADRPQRDNYERGDDSQTDFCFGLALKTWFKFNPRDDYYCIGSTEEKITMAILTERGDLSKKGGRNSHGALSYAEKTAHKIMKISDSPK
ncbi:MAG: DNA-primase RepB domain-containing protein [Desulfuromonadales bacterium]